MLFSANNFTAPALAAPEPYIEESNMVNLLFYAALLFQKKTGQFVALNKITKSSKDKTDVAQCV